MTHPQRGEGKDERKMWPKVKELMRIGFSDIQVLIDKIVDVPKNLRSFVLPVE
jgi:hypothetical protein